MANSTRRESVAEAPPAGWRVVDLLSPPGAGHDRDAVMDVVPAMGDSPQS
ncbi:hypothetical protein ACFYZJ_12290 [Streptomyces sp. NPDC001848]